MLITASNPLTTTPTVTGKNTSPENNQNITEELPKIKNKLGLSFAKLRAQLSPRGAFFSEKKNQVNPNTKSLVEENPAISSCHPYPYRASSLKLQNQPCSVYS